MFTFECFMMIGEYVSLYQVQRGLLRRRAQQLTSERLALKERTEKLIRLLPQLAPQLEKLPQWNRLAHDGVPASTGISLIQFSHLNSITLSLL